MHYNTTKFPIHPQHLERLIIPHCQHISNKTLAEVLRQNPSLLHLDISNKEKPKVDASIVDTIARSCRNLTVLKLSDYRVEDPKVLLVLCGKKLVDPAVRNREERGRGGGQRGGGCGDVAGPFSVLSPEEYQVAVSQQDLPGSSRNLQVCANLDQAALNNQEYLLPVTSNPLSDIAIVRNRLDKVSLSPSASCSPALRYAGEVNVVSGGGDYSLEECVGQQGAMVSYGTGNQDMNSHSEAAESTGERGVACATGGWIQEGGMLVVDCAIASGACVTREEQMNAMSSPTGVGGSPSVVQGAPQLQDGSRAGGEVEEESEEEDEGEEQVEDLYETDEPITPLDVEDYSAEFGCLDLETLWLDYVNLTDQVAAVLIQSLPRLRDLNFCDTNICNPWRLLDPSRTIHLKYLERLDVRSTALSRTALEMIPQCHPDLQKFSISSTMLPPPTYANIGRLTGVAELELIGGQFYPNPPEDIFQQGISPAVCSIGKHLVSLNLTYFAHVEFEVIPLNCPKLEHLDLSNTVIHLTYPCASLGQHCPQLTSLNLNFCRVEAHEAKTDDDLYPVSVPEDVALEKMIGEPPNIEELQLGGLCIEDATMRGIFPGYFHPLRVLNVSRCKQLTIQGVKHIWERCPYIRTVDMTHCKEVTVNDFQEFKQWCFELRPRFKVEGRIEWQ